MTMAVTLTWAEGTPPSVEEYCALRRLTDLGDRNAEAARIGLANTLHAVTARDGDKLIGMGRIIGDGGTFVQVTDIGVDPAYQGRGIGTEVVRRLNLWCDQTLPPTCYISLIADPGAEKLYERAGFSYVTGMCRHVG